jgi:tetratricopeptide (TPR) repeat protein
MWLFTQYGFYSVVAQPNEDDQYLVRSRVRNDLENLKSLAQLNNEILENAGTDYRYRLILSGEEWSRALGSLGAAIDYSNFKERIGELPDQRGKSAFYQQVWSSSIALKEPSLDEVANEENDVRPLGMSAEDVELEEMYQEAVARGQNGDHEGALEILEQLLERAPQVPVGHWMKGVHLAALGRYEAAVWAFSEGLEIDPHDPHALWNMALACTRTGRYEAAILSLKHALEVEPDFSDALLLLGHVYAGEQNIETPLNLDEWLMQHEPGELDLDAANTFFLLTLAYLALEDEEMAREQWETLRERDYLLADQLEPWLEDEIHIAPPDDWQERNDDLRAALERAARWDARGLVPAEATEMVYRAFMDSWLLVPLNDEPREGESGGASLSLRSGILEGIGNQTGLVAFTDEEAEGRFFGGTPEHNIVLSGGDLCRALAQMAGRWTQNGHAPAALVLNPAGPHPYALGLTNLVFLATGGVPLDAEHAVISEGTTVEIRRAGADEMPPEGLLEAVREAITQSASETGAQEVWWFILSFGEGEPHLGLGVFPGDQTIVDAVGRAINEVWWEHAPSLAVYDVLGMEGDMEIRIRKGGELLWSV